MRGFLFFFFLGRGGGTKYFEIPLEGAVGREGGGFVRKSFKKFGAIHFSGNFFL